MLNANDWLNNASNVKQPADVYYYPGATIGGPIIIPGTNFNKSRQKLFFWTGFEYFYQVLDTGLLRATTPPACELTGDFSPSCVAQEGNPNASGKAPGQINQSVFPNYQIPMCTGTPNGKCIDPNMLALVKLFPAPNADPAQTGGYNYTQSEIFNQNNRQWAIRGDWNISDNTKVFIRYNYQREVQLFPVGLWWRNTDQVPYPTPVQGRNKSNSWAGTLTHIFSPTLTNEFVGAYTFVGFPNVFANPAAVNRSNVGFNYYGVFQNNVQQIPSFGNFGPSEAALIFNPGGFEAGGPSQGLYANKYMPSFSDTLTKVVANHTIKVGFFYEWIKNAQPANNNTNGEMLVSVSNPFTYGNEYADLLTGNLNSFQQTNFNRINSINYTTIEGFAQDSWKVTRKLTVNYGMRFSHFTPWQDGEGYGYSIFNLAQYAPDCSAAPTFCGFEWHSKDPSVPNGGFPTRALFYQPRVGAAYDITGDGKTILRGGWGQFVYHSGQFTNGLDASAGVATANLSPSNWVGGPGCPTNPKTGSALFAYELSCLNVAASPASPSAVNSQDNNQPYTQSWSVTLDRATPWQGQLEVAYVGNRSRDLQNTNGGEGANLNLVPYGAMLTNSNPATANANCYRVLNDPVTCNGYGDVVLATNNLYANYNALQVNWIRHSGRFTVQANYTFQKSMGIVSPNNNPFDLASNYGVLPSDRRNLFNMAFSIDAGTLVHSNKFVNGAVNGWQFSGIIQAQSGANLTYGGNYSNQTPNLNYNMSLTCQATAAEIAANELCPTSSGPASSGPAIIPGSISTVNPAGIPINNQSILGTPSENLNPYLTCNPEANLGPHQYVNSNCFQAPTNVGKNGPTLLPVAYGPAYFNWDQAIFKNFHITESKYIQFRAEGFNWLNHPLYSFPSGNNLTLQFVQDPVTQVITQQNSNFGIATQKQGQRIIQFTVKFFF